MYYFTYNLTEDTLLISKSDSNNLKSIIDKDFPSFKDSFYSGELDELFPKKCYLSITANNLNTEKIRTDFEKICKLKIINTQEVNYIDSSEVEFELETNNIEEFIDYLFLDSSYNYSVIIYIEDNKIKNFNNHYYNYSL